MHGAHDPNETAVKKDTNLDKPKLKGDWSNFFLLILLYIMQGIPLGLSHAMPIILQSRKNVSFKDQALFSVTFWPFSIKIILAPLVDALYIQKIGKRKSWVIPVQFLIGVCFFYLANNIDELLPETGKPNILKLVYVFFVTIMLAATQDIAVDGWALTMLKKNNVGYSSTCNTTGVVTGKMIGSLLFVLFTSEDFCNKYLRVSPGTGGIMTMKSLFYIWGAFFIIITTLIAIFKKEKDDRLEDNHVKLSILQSYSLLWDISKLPSIRKLAIALFTVMVGFAATDSVSMLKLIDNGVPKDNIMVIFTAMSMVKMIIPLVLGKYTSGPKPLSIYLNMIPFRLFWNIPYFALVYYTPKLINFNGIIDIPLYYYAILVFILSIHDVLMCMMSVVSTAYFTRISDSRFGGTYMTLLNTLSNSGSAWSHSIAIGMVDFLTFKECSLDSTNKCSSMNLQNMCAADGGHCNTRVNGYYIEVAVCTFIGIIWLGIFRSILKNLETKDPINWMVHVKKTTKDNDICDTQIM